MINRLGIICLFIFFVGILSACTEVNQNKQLHADQVKMLEAEIVKLTDELDAKEQKIQENQSQLDSVIGMEDQLTIKKILEAIDFNDKAIDIRDNELMMSAGMADPASDHPTSAVIEIAVYQHQDHAEAIRPLKAMFLQVQKDGEKWRVESFSRSN